MTRLSPSRKLAEVELTTLDEAQGLAGTYRLLARLWMHEVDELFLRELQRNPLRESFEAAGGFVPDQVDDPTLEELAIDYCQLFIGPKYHVPPFQSVWQSQRLNGEPVKSMSQFIDIVGYDNGELPDGILLDHFAVQFDVMGHILQQFALNPGATESLNEISHGFRIAHLDWTKRLLETAQEKATTEFYRSAIRLTQDFLSQQ
jgi:TorA maturation chaperone TorD